MPPRKRKPDGRHRAEEDAPREGQFIQPVGPSTAPGAGTRRDSRPRHASKEPTKPRKPREDPAPRSSPPAPSSSPSSGPGRRRRVTDEQASAAREEGIEYARRAAIRAGTTKPTITGRAGAGAAAGAATGAALGSVVPGVGTAVGAGTGAVLGGVGGGVSGAQAKRAYKAAMRPYGRLRRVIVIEFLICMAIVALSPMTDRRRDEPAGSVMKRLAAVLGLFFVLGLMSAGSAGLARFSAGLGGLVTIVLAVSERNLFATIAGRLSARDDAPTPAPLPDEDPGPADTGRVGQRLPGRRGVAMEGP